MFEDRQQQPKRWLRQIVFYIFVASITIIVMSAFTIDFRAKLEEPKICGYSACSEVLVAKDPVQAQFLNCRCQCESTQILTAECAQVYECVRSETCWRLDRK